MKILETNIQADQSFFHSCVKCKHTKRNHNINYSIDFIVFHHKFCVFGRIPHHFEFFLFCGLCIVASLPLLTPTQRKQQQSNEGKKTNESNCSGTKKKTGGQSHLLSGNPNMIYCITSRGLWFYVCGIFATI